MIHSAYFIYIYKFNNGKLNDNSKKIQVKSVNNFIVLNIIILNYNYYFTVKKILLIDII
jgi:hypothetical protein